MSQFQPRVSIVTIAYNAEDYIERTIKSVANQTYSNIEYIIIDGASKDNTLQVVERYREHVDICVSEPDKNLYDAMNKGIDRATGDYVLFMNAGDCIADSKALPKMLEHANGEDFIYARALFISEEGKTRPWRKKTPPANKINAKSFINGMVVCHHCMMVKRTIIPHYKLGPWQICCDVEWSIRVMKNVKTAHYYDGIFCHFLEGGLSDQKRFQAVRERFDISVLHFGWPTAILQQFKIAWGVVLRGGKLS